MLQEPFLNLQRSMAYNYGSLGTIIGHEISHSLDNKGRHSNKEGIITVWWNEADVITYNTRIKCYEEQYDKLGADGEQSVGENLADNVGLAITYAAFMKSNAIYTVELLSDADVSDSQMFFISFAQVITNFCSEDE